MYKNAKYLQFNGENSSISVEINGFSSVVPLDPANSDYIALMALVAEGKLTIAEAE